jgi:hypothetical protein
MTNKPRKFASNFEINQGSILLIFNEHDAKIAKDWRKSTKKGHGIGESGSLAA